MNAKLSHGWDITPAEAIAVQQELRAKVITEDRIGQVHHVAGVDVGYINSNTIARAAIAVLSMPQLELKQAVIAHREVSFPYIPGLLSFREVPVVLEALEQLKVLPDILLCDGQGIAHPRRFGIASHIGVLCDIATIGVAKSKLLGEHDEVPQTKGAWCALYHRGEVIGAAVRTRVNTRVLYISIGHRVSLASAIEYVMACVTRYRLPETTRAAHKLASKS